MVTVMKLEKAPQETYADIGGLDTQIQEIKVCVFAVKLPFRNSLSGSGICGVTIDASGIL
jgi:ATP-dependent 26S proteasome regulatory subunit